MRSSTWWVLRSRREEHGLIGAVVGALTGPLGLLLGGAAAAMAGELIDVTEDQERELILEAMMQRIPAGTTALLADVQESTTEAVDTALEKLGAVQFARWARDEVEAELMAADEATAAGRRETRRMFHRRKAAAARA